MIQKNKAATYPVAAKKKKKAPQPFDQVCSKRRRGASGITHQKAATAHRCHRYAKDLEARWDGIFCATCGKKISHIDVRIYHARAPKKIERLLEEQYQSQCEILDLSWAIKKVISLKGKELEETTIRIFEFLKEREKRGVLRHQLRLPVEAKFIPD